MRPQRTSSQPALDWGEIEHRGRLAAARAHTARLRQGQVGPLPPPHPRNTLPSIGPLLGRTRWHKTICSLLRTELLGCYSDQDFLAKLHCVRQAFEVGVLQGPLGRVLGLPDTGPLCAQP